jgi:hypothetical protein
MKVTNNSGAVQGIQALHGVAYLKPGEAKELSLTAKQADRAGRLKFIELKGEPVEDDTASLPGVSQEGQDGVYLKPDEFNQMRESFEGLTNENKSLREKVAELEGEIAKLRSGDAGDADKGSTKTAAEVLAMAEDGTPFMTFKAEAEKLLGEKTPAKKVEIVAALEELATNP